MNAPREAAAQPAEQLRYARVLQACTWLGLVVLVLSFGAYVFGLLSPHVALERLPALWSLPLASFLEQTRTPTGWGWLVLLRQGDIAGMAGIAILAGCSLLCLLVLVPLYLKRGERLYAALCLAEAAVVGLAASGWLTGGH